MNKKLLFFIAFCASGLQAQTPVTHFLDHDNTTFQTAVSATPLDQTATGPDNVWNFTGLLATGSRTVTYDMPTDQQIIDYPNTTQVATVAITPNENGNAYVFIAESGNSVSITGSTNASGVDLNYITNNYKIGDLPMAFGYTHDDVIAGTYVMDTYSGTFTGTATTNVDAYGTLSVNLLPDTETTPLGVTRVKTVQTASLNYAAFPNVGTVTQTVYSYFHGSQLVLRSTTSNVSVPVMQVNETAYMIEVITEESLSVPTQSQLVFSIAPNPVQDVLQINSGAAAVTAVTIADAFGRIVVQDKSGAASLSVSALPKGIYFATIATDSGNMTKKIIKK